MKSTAAAGAVEPVTLTPFEDGGTATFLRTTASSPLEMTARAPKEQAQSPRLQALSIT